MTLSRHYPRLTVVPFGKQLLESGDLDPIYTALQGLDFRGHQLARWLTAYWLFYNAGFASWASEREGVSYWKALAVAAENKHPSPLQGKWPRGSERRHMRGEAAVKAVASLQTRFSKRPEDFVYEIMDGPNELSKVMERVRGYYLFGSWIAFKVADMLDAVCGYPIEQSNLELFLYDTPRKSILTLWQARQLPLKAQQPEAALEEAFHWLQDQLKGVKVPHKPKLKAPDWFALETVWCKHKSHLGGHYPLYKDVIEIDEAVAEWAKVSPTAKQFRSSMPSLPRKSGLLGR